MSVLLVLCALLIVAGGVSLVAAAMGNPVRIGPLSVPGPDGALERAVIGVVGAVCVAAVLPLVLMGRNSAGEPFAVANATSTPEPSATTVAASPTASPTPPAGPSVVAASPGVPTVTSVAVGQDAATGCVRTFTATVHISDGPVAVRYRAYANGVVVGEPNRTKTVSGTGARTLDSILVTASHSGDVKVRFDVLGPNPSILTGSATWTAPAACDPPPPTTTTSPPPPKPALAVSLTLPGNYTGPCVALPQFHIDAQLAMGAGAPAAVVYHLVIDNFTVASNSVMQSTAVPYDTGLGAGTHTVSFDAGSADTNPTSDQKGGSFTVTCDAPV